MRKQLLLFVLGMFPLGISFAQQADQKMLPSSSGGQNQSMGSLASPNLFDGSANINIPIHEYGAFGISLSYNTKGVPVEELSSQVGTHWVLNSGGSITRTVKDIPDEANESFDATSGVNDIEYSILGRAHAYTAQGSQPVRQYRDGENDEFNVSAGSLQFTFMVGKEGHIFTYPENKYKITPIANSYNPNGTHIYDKFEITDEHGTKYTFATKAEEMEGSISFGNTTQGTAMDGHVLKFYYTPKWYLDKVEFTNGQAILYTYESMDYPEHGSATEGLSLYRTRSRNYKDNNTHVLDPEQDPVWMAELQEVTYILKSIQYPDNTTVNFIFDQGAGYLPSCMKSIKQIEINQEGNCIKYRFNKAYLKQSSGNYQLAEEVPFDNGCNYNPTDGGSKRMILKGIDILNCDESKAQPYYSFEYSNAAPPARLGNNRDFFGYCNGIDGYDYTLFPTNCKSPFDSSNGPNTDCNRCPATDVNIMAALCLTKVKNAYGGSLSFQYELHSGLVSVTDGLTGMPDPDLNYANHLFLGKNKADGLRLYRTIAEDKYRPASKLITTYTYSGGQFFLNGGYYAYPTIKDANGNIKEYKATTNWVSAHQLINGSNHGYSQVTVTTTDNNSNMLSRTIHHFSNFKNNNEPLSYILNGPDAKDYFQAPYTDKQYIKDWKLGLPIKTETFDKSGNITSRTTNVYDMASADDFSTAETWLDVNVHRMRVSVIPVYGSPGNPIVGIMDPAYNLATDSYVPFRGKSLLVSTTTEKFVNNNNAITDIAEFSYDDRRNLIQTKTRNSKNEFFLTKNIYNYNVSGAAALTAMTNAGLETVISTERWKKGSASPSGDQLLDASITTFKYENGILSTQKVQALESLLPISYNNYTNSGAAIYNRILTAYNNPTQALTNFKVVSEVLKYDDKHNPVETQIAGQNNFLSMIWDQATGNKLATANCKLNEMGFTGFETMDNGNWTYNQANVIMPSNVIGVMDGHYVLKANSYETIPFLKINKLTANKEYTLTFWSKGGIVNISGGGINGYISYTMLYGKDNGWKYYQARFTPLISNSPVIFELNNSGSPFSNYIDDVRLFPTGATMTCGNYEPLWGASSSIDPTGRITYYEYDSFGRVVVTRDQEGKIIAKKDYHIAQ